MPLLLCPNDNSSMQSVHRSGVEFEMCPTCRGVWLDRGELEKMMEQARYAQPIDPPPPPQGQPRYDPAPRPSIGYGGERGEWGERGERGEWGERGEHGERGWDGGRKRRGLGIFDIFD